MHIEAKDLQFGDTVIFEGETYHVIEATPNTDGGINVFLSPSDGIGLDRYLAVPAPFSFWTISRIEEM